MALRDFAYVQRKHNLKTRILSKTSGSPYARLKSIMVTESLREYAKTRYFISDLMNKHWWVRSGDLSSIFTAFDGDTRAYSLRERMDPAVKP